MLITVSEPERLEAVLHKTGHRVLERVGPRVAVSGEDARAVSRVAFEHRIDVDRLTVDEPSLEEAYFRLTTGKESIR